MTSNRSDTPTNTQRREASVYDAVAGRISSTGFISDELTTSTFRDTASSSFTPVGPESVLFRRKDAPVRYEETDTYFAHESLQDGDLPDTDLLTSLHCYASDFYARATPDAGSTDWKSMDETALLALGILMEEICRESLGETGDLVFTEGRGDDETLQNLSRGRRETTATATSISKSDASARSGHTRRKKRRKPDVDDDMAEQDDEAG